MRTHWKYLFCLLLVSLAVLLPGCTGTADPGKDTEPSVTDAPVAQDLAIVSDGTVAYTVIVREDASESQTAAARSIVSAIESLTGVKPQWTDDYVETGDTPAVKEILVGLTNRAESLQVLGDLKYGEYAIRIVGEKIVIAAWDDASLTEACRVFADRIRQLGGAGQLTLPNDYAAQDTEFSPLLQLPHYGSADECVQFIDLADECYLLYADDTDVAEFQAYFEVLENAGYTQFATRQMGDNLYATYVSDTKVINAAYTASKKDARIAIEDAYDLTLFTEQEYEKVCEPTVTLVGQEVKVGDSWVNNALCLVFRLEDGRFIVVDSGYSAFSVGQLDKALRSLHVNEGKITIAAWIFTHAHSDHTGGFTSLTNTSYKNGIVVENFVHHFVSDAQHNAIDGSGSGPKTRTAMLEYPDANIIKAHTGQVIKAGGVEIEMLFTYADMEPEKLDEMNTTSLVFRVTAQDNSVMVLGDASNRSLRYLISTYGDYMKSDMVQIAHHGYNGVAEAYSLIDADVILWPGGVDQFYGRQDYYRLMDWEFNKRALELADECYVAGDSIFTLTMPYKPENNSPVKIYDGEN